MTKDHFHSCLLTIFLPVVSLPIVWGVALYDLSRRPVAPEERLPRLHPAVGMAGSIGLSSVLFAALHLSYGLYVTPVFLFSAVAGWARLRTGSVRAPVILHVLFNAAVALGTFAR